MSGLCLVCGQYGTNSIGIRCRDTNANAVWAPNLDAWLCDSHARSGCVIEILIRPTSDGRVRVNTGGPSQHGQTVLVIGSGGRKEIPGQESLGV